MMTVYLVLGAFVAGMICKNLVLDKLGQVKDVIFGKLGL